jgi:glycosyltransferase involved in cell wall biosynthesis/GNAT superfamily N-acetyltransferase
VNSRTDSRGSLAGPCSVHAVPVRVLWVIKGLGPGGAETLLAAAAQAHDRDRFHIECAYVLPYKDHLAGRLEEAGVITHCLSRSDSDVRWSLRLTRLIRDGGWDVVHTHSPLPASVARLAARSMGSKRPKLVSTEHNAWGTFGRPTRLANRLTFGSNDAVFAVSDEARRSISGGKAATATALRHGIDVAHVAGFSTERAPVRNELGVGDDEFVIGTVANFRVQKDYPNFLRAARMLRDRDVTVRFVVVGQGPLKQETRRLAEELHLQEDVVFTGFRADAVRVMSAFDVFTLASSWEGLPVALMEAMALGLPVVATDVGGVSETLTDGADALLVPPSNSAALSDGWARVVSDADLRSQLAAASAARANEFDVSRAEQTVEETYASLAPASAEPAEPPKPKARRSVGLDIRPSSPVDRAAILTLLQRSLGWGDDPRFAQLFRWKHETNAFGPSPTWVATDGDRIVGVRIFMRWEFVRGGQVLRAVRAVDTATDPDYQGRGLFTALTLHALDEVRAEGVDFVFNTPNSQSRPGYLKMGWREVGRIPAAVRPRSPASALRMARARVASEHWSHPLAIGRPFDKWADDNVGLAPASDLPIRTLATNVSDEFYRWRFGGDLLGYRVVENDAGAAVVRARQRGRALELVHLASFGLAPSDADVLTGASVAHAGADHVIRLGAPNPRHGFVPLPGSGPVLTWRALNEQGQPPLPNWSLTMGDIELF